MQALVPDGHGSVTMSEVTEPVCAADGVVIAVRAFSVNRGETFLLNDPPPRWRPGKDVAGELVAVGPGVARSTGLTVGDRVVAHVEGAGWAEQVAARVDQVAALPDAVRTMDAAALPLAGLTALRLIRAIGSLPGRSILLTGASGGVGHYFVELAAGVGARVTAVTSSPERGQRLQQLGAENVVTDLDRLTSKFEVVVDSVGGASFAAAWRCLDPDGLFVWMGQASHQPPTLDFFDWAGGANATLRKFLYSESAVPDGEDLGTLVRLVENGRLHPEIGAAEPWGSTAEVLADLVDRRIRGNAVLEVKA